VLLVVFVGLDRAPKGTVHLHSHLIATAELYAKPILGIRESDVVFSAASSFSPTASATRSPFRSRSARRRFSWPNGRHQMQFSKD